ncbi:hypothetical protein C0991_011013 [Blastosporella zonata]|nr:hypothetical protein C0991_011013 [Blastosporella zonata]
MTTAGHTLIDAIDVGLGPDESTGPASPPIPVPSVEAPPERPTTPRVRSPGPMHTPTPFKSTAHLSTRSCCVAEPPSPSPARHVVPASPSPFSKKLAPPIDDTMNYGRVFATFIKKFLYDDLACDLFHRIYQASHSEAFFVDGVLAEDPSFNVGEAEFIYFVMNTRP